MDIQSLNTFGEVARTRSITSAARTLHTVQSNVTSRIKGLEDELGTALFQRLPRGMQLTDAGARLLPYAERLQALLREAREAVQDDRVARGTLVIGSMETTAALRLPTLLARYRAECPEVQIMLRTGPTAELLAQLAAREIDAAFVNGPVEQPGFDAHPAFQEKLVLVVPAALRSVGAVRKRLSASAAAAERLSALMFRVGCSYRQRLEEVLARLGCAGFSRIEFGTLDGIVGCVAAGLGVTLLPRAVVQRASAAGDVNCLSGPELREMPMVTQTLLVTRSDAPPAAAMRRLRQLLGAQGRV
jgi:LysR family transcriptional regulator, cell division regulator